VVSTEPGSTDSEEVVYIGRSETAMWMRIVSGWMCMLLYMWSLLAPVLLPDRQVTLTRVPKINLIFFFRFGDL
jgi:serine incorporator 1/3